MIGCSEYPVLAYNRGAGVNCRWNEMARAERFVQSAVKLPC
jgi:hypothetical protein